MAMLNNQMVQIEVWMSFDDFWGTGGAIAGWKACFSNVSDRAGQEGDRLSCHTHILYTCSSLLVTLGSVDTACNDYHSRSFLLGSRK